MLLLGGACTSSNAPTFFRYGPGPLPKIRARVLDLLKQYGHNTTSFQILEPGLKYWFDADDACVAYADTGGAWVVAGGPIAPLEREDEVMARFAVAARQARRRVRFFALERDVSATTDFAVKHVGEQPIWDPQEWQNVLRSKRSLREQVRRSRAKGVTVRLVDADELADQKGATRTAIDEMINHWIDSREMAPMGFVVHLDPYNLPEERRFFIAERGGQVVGILVAVPIYARDGWFFEDVLRDPAAPNGTIELLFDHAMRAVAAEGSRHATFGLAPLAGTKSRWLRTIRDHTRWLYDFEGLRRFKAKLVPSEWHPVYLAYPKRDSGMRAVIDILAAFARGSFVKFGWRTLIHRARAVVLVLAILLLPWTAVMAAVDTEHWFPSRTVQLAWLAYDAMLFAALVTLAMRWRRWFAALLSLMALADFSVGCVQAVLFNAERAGGVVDWVAICAALLAPGFAAMFLWASRGRAELYQ